MAPCVVSVSTIVCYSKVMGHDVTAAKIFTALALFRMLQDPLRGLPSCITQIVQAMSSVQRLEEFLDLPEKASSGASAAARTGEVIVLPDRFVWYDFAPRPAALTDQSPSPGKISLLSRVMSGKLWKTEYSRVSSDIELVNNPMTSQTQAFSLNITERVCVSPGQLVVVTGSVGAGKSSLLAALLGEMYSQAPSLSRPELCGSVAYCSQQAWIQNMTLRENILFGLPFDATKYERVLDACLLMRDFLDMPAYDFTEIGEKVCQRTLAAMSG